ncbi:thioredoxin domain-containing protein 17-like [Toxorhynchites rutilus septentrionalis]|uniref:thioredoxin domain-containing protein 17-like n=1 Tax=Toxorhynchites rutilus septentrionalis TaxID=329112 RepID=UPI002478F109|nr:thioredoxin domain-containing protein 17-like [Toxorhynchites rutilus septentrionalis]
MVQKHTVAGYESFLAFMRDFPSDGQIINVLFTGAKQENGVSWCSDCVEATPFIEEALAKAPEGSHFVYVDVGDRPTWKDMNNPFRKDTSTHLSVIPTLVRWKNPQRIEGEQCAKPDLLEMFFTDDD